ncbi:hypothetical protein KXV92_007768 [Aspergillus fumigatus]|nr:hypothetical protein KXW88_003963 [Aspergillus fumigatus]KAH2361874.1 hypothetical protein KXV98_006558 [Aspergillus fumigatus]KAH3181485.1 hypothetical protein KXV92_007768 [Aspergillus fumigatus]KAJ8225845.1 hypothetical protein LV156_009047 [Aspergillus fumigatus]KAJ8227595.1 hypothetical protein LV160_009049 [Aspergillus fumigatus]
MSTIRSIDVSREYSIPSLTEQFTIACLVAIAWYNAIELIVLCFATFKKYYGFYFWALVISSISILPFGLGYILIIFDICPGYYAVAVEEVGWCGMVTGQSFVLWSRLHLLVYSRKVLRGTLTMIIVNAVILHTVGWILEFGAHSNHASRFTQPFEIFERTQLIGFSIQEIILSAIYTTAAVRLLRSRPQQQFRSVLIQLVIVNIIFILMDAAVVSFQYEGLFRIHVSVKAMVYSVKLKLEYAVLGKLVHISHSNAVPTDPSHALKMSRRTNYRSDVEQIRQDRGSLTSILG